MKTWKNVWIALALVWVAGCAADPASVREAEVDAVGEDLGQELLDVLAGVDEEGADPGAARENLLARLVELRERYEAAIAANEETGAASEALRDPSARRDLLVVGDSLSAGGTSDGAVGWVPMMEAAHADRNIANLAVGGTTAMDWAGGRPELTAALDAELALQPETVVVFLGGNDVITFEAFADDGVADAGSLGRAIQGLIQVITHVRLRSPRSRIVLGTYYDLFDLRSVLIPPGQPIAGLPGSQFRATSWNTIALNLVIHALGAITGSEVVDLYGPYMNHGYGNIWLGGGNTPYFVTHTFDVHPNTAGHRVIADLFGAQLGY